MRRIWQWLKLFAHKFNHKRMSSMRYTQIRARFRQCSNIWPIWHLFCTRNQDQKHEITQSKILNQLFVIKNHRRKWNEKMVLFAIRKSDVNLVWSCGKKSCFWKVSRTCNKLKVANSPMSFSTQQREKSHGRAFFCESQSKVGSIRMHFYTWVSFLSHLCKFWKS